MQPTNNHATDMGATEIFRMPSADATVPDLMAQEKPAHPTLTIVKVPRLVRRSSSTRPSSLLAATRATASS